jgi:hypothetical protein
MRRPRGRLAIVGLVALASCERSTPAAPATAAPSDVAPEAVAEPSFVEASGRAASEGVAYAIALHELAKTLLGDPAWLEVVPLEIHDRRVDALALETDAQGMTRVTVGLSRVRAATILSAFTETELRIDGPPAWRETLQTFFLAHVARNACERRRALFETECETVDTAEVDAALAELASGVVLAPAYFGGVPLDGQARPLRAPRAYVLWRGLPASDVPVVAHWPGETEAAVALARSDSRGEVAVGLAAERPWPGAMSLAVDAQAFLGPLHDRFPEVSVSVAGRPVDLQRWGAVVRERGGRVVLAADPVVDGLNDHLKHNGVAGATAIPEKHSNVIASAETRKLSEKLTAMADALAGRVDVLFVVELDSRYTSRMGGGRVWYEARGELEAFDVWSGQRLASIRTSATASGLGNERADEAARRALGQALAQLVLASPDIPAPPTTQPVAVSARDGQRVSRE